MSTVIGINFGNSASSIAVATADGKADIIANQDGERSIPTALAYAGEDEYYGGQALAQLLRNPTNTIIGFRDYLGVPFEKIDPTSAGNGAKPFNLDGKVGYKIKRSEDKEEILTIDEVVSRHLTQLKLSAEDFIGSSIDGVVIGIPTNFNEEQQKALVAASEKAGMKVLQLIKEPSAALLAYTTNVNELAKDKLYVVADFGGLRSDAAVIAVRSGIMTILETAHDYELGGAKIDSALAEYFAKEFEKKFKSNPRNNHKSITKLQAATITTKKTLSNVTTATISIDSLNDGYDFHSTINRMRFDLAARSVASQMTTFVENIVKKAGYDTLDIDEILLVGGTSFVPKIAANLEAVFPESVKIISPATPKAIDPVDLIARGAALQASMIESFDEAEVKEALQPVIVNTPHLTKALGILDAEGKFVQILRSEAATPVRRSIKVAAPKGDALISIYEAERDIKETTVEQAPKEEKEEDDEESDWSDDEDDEPEIIREKIFVPKAKIADLVVKDVSEGATIEITIDINKNNELQVFAREDKPDATVTKVKI
ncbi:Ssz1 protein [Saccharomycopsis crataegensis]|uniref:Ssz1 protein n=1 Tax=Saccharomycopsis crataegensis TaxID=43959 RepID=A0AAV5QRT9_9ASCO|nr:Ssz1 protein [Saccharomycopsis crataegensis]